MAEHNILGKNGELFAKDYLLKNNYSLLELSWRYKHKEVDIIAIDNSNNDLVFVEVKTRSDNYWGNPEDFVTRQKQKFLIQAAEAYIEKNNINSNTRFDIISVIFNNNTFNIEQIKNSFYP